MTPVPSKVLFVRTDGIGDLVLMLPALQALKRQLPGVSVDVLCSEYAAPVLENNPLVGKVFRLRSRLSAGGFFQLASALRAERYDGAILFFVSAVPAALLFFAGIPLRSGPFSKPASLFLNIRVSQHRSRAARHEAGYNAELLPTLFPQVVPECPAPEIFLTEPEKAGADAALARLGFAGGALVGINPGGRGSNLLLPTAKFFELSDGLLAAPRGISLLFTGLEREIRVFRERYGTNKKVLIPAAGDLRQLAALISKCAVFIANSTGPLHIASALGVSTVSFFSPLKVTKPVRWAPLHRPGVRHAELAPGNPDECLRCDGPSCRYGGCMDRIDTAAALRAVLGLF